MKNVFLLGLSLAFLMVPGFCLGAEFEANSVAEIQAAFDVAASNGEDDTIRIAAGTHSVGSTLTFISKEQYSLRIEGEGRGVTVLDGGGQVRVMAVDTIQTGSDHWTNITVSGASFINGHTEDGGGGGLSVIVDLADIVVTKCRFEGNVANPPEESFIDRWRSNGGGGLFIANGAFMRNRGRNVEVKSCVFKNNTSYNGGGAYIHAEKSSYWFTEFNNNVLVNNHAAFNAGAVWIEAKCLTFDNNTITGNEALSDGGGVYFWNVWRNDVFNNIIWSNDAGGEGKDFYFSDKGDPEYIRIFSNTFGSYSFLEGDTLSEGENSDETPLLDGDYNLLPGSPCIDTGNNDAPELDCGDFNNHERIHGATVDRGAIEFGSTTPADPDCDNTDPIDPPVDPPSGSAGGGGCFLGVAMGIDQDSDAYKAAKRVADRHNSPEVQAAIKAAKKRLQPRVKKQCRQFNQDAARSARDTIESDRPELLVFVSTSMPHDSTIEFARDAYQIRENSDVRFVLRGFPEGGLTDFLQNAHAKQFTLNLTVDPFLFDTYEVDKVPAVVVNRAVKINHPRNLKSALTRTQAASDQNLTALIRDLDW